MNNIFSILKKIIFTIFLFYCTSIICLAQNSDFRNLNFRTKLKYQDQNSKNSAKLYVRMKKDSLIWLQISANIGIRGLRALVTKDSTFVIDYVNKEYAKYDFKTLSKEINFQLNYTLVQSILLGDMPYPDYEESDVKKVSKKLWIISQKKGFLLIENHINPKTKKLIKLNLTDLDKEDKLFLNYNKYKKIKGYNIPMSQDVKIIFKEHGRQSETKISLKHKKPKINVADLLYPFKISKRYKSKQIKK